MRAANIMICLLNVFTNLSMALVWLAMYVVQWLTFRLRKITFMQPKKKRVACRVFVACSGRPEDVPEVCCFLAVLGCSGCGVLIKEGPHTCTIRRCLIYLIVSFSFFVVAIVQYTCC